MANFMFEEKETRRLSAKVAELERLNGIACYSTTCESVHTYACDKWDCVIRCYCSQSWK